MRQLTPALCLLLLILCAPAATVHAESPFSIEADLDGDGRVESITLDTTRDPAVSVRRGGRLLWEGVHGRWRPWKLTVADVDGDGRKEIVVGVFKSTKFIPRPHNCLFIYDWDGRRAAPKWLGSTLSRPFTDFRLADGDGDGRDEVYALETRRDGRVALAAYSWNGFGFTRDWERGDWQKAALLAVTRDAIRIEADGRAVTLQNKNSTGD
ncbi:MAG TPA: VCBS repeat-containing protein [Pyrinomonadaceae bacterium]|nr:VCBS repeat-containing protein [Pyrinomonadaceae bacterium]